MRFRTPRVVVVGFFLCLMALARWGEAAEGRPPTWLTAPDTIPPERVLWEGVAVPLEEARRRAAIEEAKQLKARRRAAIEEAKQLEAEQRAAVEGAKQLEAEQREAERRAAIEGAKQSKTKQSKAKTKTGEALTDTQRKKDPEARLREAIEKGHHVALGGPVDVVPRQAPPLNPQEFPVVTIGRPEVWHLPDLYPLQHMPLPMQAQLQGADFYLIRLPARFGPLHGPGWAGRASTSSCHPTARGANRLPTTSSR